MGDSDDQTLHDRLTRLEVQMENVKASAGRIEARMWMVIMAVIGGGIAQIFNMIGSGG